MFVDSNSNKSCFSNMAPQTQVPKGCNCFHSNTLKLFFSLLCEYLLRNRIRQRATNPEGAGGIDRPGGLWRQQLQPYSGLLTAILIYCRGDLSWLMSLKGGPDEGVLFLLWHRARGHMENGGVGVREHTGAIS